MKKLVDGVLVDFDDADMAQAAADAQRAVQPLVRITNKADLWRRCSDDEADTLSAALEQAPARLRGIYQDALYLDPADPDYPMIRDAIVSAFGETRAAELLAPS